jgi:hypothetical protein
MRSAESALTAITEIFYSDVTDRVAADRIGYILSEAGYGPHARKGRGVVEPASPKSAYRAHELRANGNVMFSNAWFQGHRREDGKVFVLFDGSWQEASPFIASSFRPF